MAKSMVLVLLLVIGGMLLGGCAYGSGTFPEWKRLPGLVDDGPTRLARTGMIDDIQDRQMIDDWDYIWLYDRNNRLSEWHVEAGR